MITDDRFVKLKIHDIFLHLSALQTPDRSLDVVFHATDLIAGSVLKIKSSEDLTKRRYREILFLYEMGTRNAVSVHRTLKGNLGHPNMVRFYETTKQIDDLLTDFTKAISLDGGELKIDLDIASDVCSRVLSDSAFGIESLLSDIDAMIKGDTDIYRQPIFASYELFFRETFMLDETAITANLRAWAYYMSSRQLLGYVMWMQALKMTNGDVVMPRKLYFKRRHSQTFGDDPFA